jgi:Domain of unknown function (DUF4105)
VILRGQPCGWLAACLCACAGYAQAALPLDIDADSLTTEQIEATQQLLHEAERWLPPAMIQALGPHIVLAWDELPADVHGHASARRLQLSRHLLSDWMVRPPDADVRDPAVRAALSALIHELAHFYDRTGSGHLSKDPRLLDVAGWQVAPLKLGMRTSHNRFTDRSPDAYELTDPAEFVAVNIEHYLLDADYACRRPAIFRLFSDHFHWTPSASPCLPALPYVQVEEGEPPLLELDPARVYAVDYLLAEGNGKPMSRWGHSMLRLVICAPGRPAGPDCRLDLPYHRVLSFRAFVGDVQISGWRGMTGSYPSRLYVLPLDQVIDEYTQVELRGLRSIPLRLDPTEIAELLERAAQLHWSYDGRYYFISNNCAVETFKLLHDGVPRLAGEPLASITPTALLRRLQYNGIADNSVLDDTVEAIRLGYRFEAASAHFQDMFDIARSELGLPQERVSQWLELPPVARRPWLEMAGLRSSAALMLLEEASRHQQELRALDELKHRYLGHHGAADGKGPDSEALRAFLQSGGFMSRPATLLPDSSYGLPQAKERRLLSGEADRRVAQWLQQGDALRADARQWLPPARRVALEGAEENIALLGERLRLLHQQQGGYRIN